MTALEERLLALARRPDVEPAVRAAREACDRLRWHPAMRRRAGGARAEATLTAARWSAALEGARYPVAAFRDAARGAGGFGDDAAGRVAAGALRALVQVDEWGTAPPPTARMLARLHVAATAGTLPDDLTGRPRPAGRPPEDGFADPATAPVGAALAARLAGVGELLAAPATVPAIVVAALVHAELLAVRPFVAGNGLVARAAARAQVVARGLDPTGVAVWEAAHAAAGPDYRRRLLGYAGGDPDAVAGWLVHCAQAVVEGAGVGSAIGDAVLAGRPPSD